jgi:hypothetical protein
LHPKQARLYNLPTVIGTPASGGALGCDPGGRNRACDKCIPPAQPHRIPTSTQQSVSRRDDLAAVVERLSFGEAEPLAAASINGRSRARSRLCVQFPQPVKAAALTFLGPLLGSLIRPFGGALADRFKGSVVTSFNFLAMAFGALVVLGASQINSLPLFIVGFVMLFIFSGIGNGSTYKMIPASFTPRRSLRWALDSICWRLIAAPFPSWCLDWVGWGDRRARRCDGQPGLPAVLPDAAER